MNKSFLACALALAGIGAAHAATITPVNINAPGVGLNDPTAAVPVGGNPGTTIGQQRRIAYQFAADLWGAVLESDVEIKVEAQFTALSCTATSGTLGSAGTKSIFGGFPGAVASTWYGGALANAISGVDNDPADNDIRSNFNANLGTPGCLETSGWYYGLDGLTPTGKINFLDVVMHEIGHGLNFQGFYNLATGAVPSGTQPTWGDIYSNNVFDNATSMAWKDMTNAQRVAAAIADRLVWTGATVTGQTAAALSPQVDLFVSGTVTGNFPMVTAGYGPVATTANFNGGDIVLANDGSASPTQGCVATAAGLYAGKTVLIDRGTCSFKTKTLNAQVSGAAKVIVANNVAAGFPGMGDDALVPNPITIPSIGISQAAGTAIKAGLPGVSGALQVVPGQLSGADLAGHARLYAPAPLAQGSSFSHYDVSHFPNALQEPSINQDLDGNFRVDLSPALYQDLGWVLNAGDAEFGNCSTDVPILENPGLIPGANLIAMHEVCAARAGTARPIYRKCMSAAANGLRVAGLITPAQVTAIQQCATHP